MTKSSSSAKTQTHPDITLLTSQAPDKRSNIWWIHHCATASSEGSMFYFFPLPALPRKQRVADLQIASGIFHLSLQGIRTHTKTTRWLPVSVWECVCTSKLTCKNPPKKTAVVETVQPVVENKSTQHPFLRLVQVSKAAPSCFTSSHQIFCWDFKRQKPADDC